MKELLVFTLGNVTLAVRQCIIRRKKLTYSKSSLKIGSKQESGEKTERQLTDYFDLFGIHISRFRVETFAVSTPCR